MTPIDSSGFAQPTDDLAAVVIEHSELVYAAATQRDALLAAALVLARHLDMLDRTHAHSLPRDVAQAVAVVYEADQQQPSQADQQQPSQAVEGRSYGVVATTAAMAVVAARNLASYMGHPQPFEAPVLLAEEQGGNDWEVVLAVAADRPVDVPYAYVVWNSDGTMGRRCPACDVPVSGTPDDPDGGAAYARHYLAAHQP